MQEVILLLDHLLEDFLCVVDPLFCMFDLGFVIQTGQVFIILKPERHDVNLLLNKIYY